MASSSFASTRRWGDRHRRRHSAAAPRGTPHGHAAPGPARLALPPRILTLLPACALQQYNFINAKSASSFHQKWNPRKMAWTQVRCRAPPLAVSCDAG